MEEDHLIFYNLKKSYQKLTTTLKAVNLEKKMQNSLFVSHHPIAYFYIIQFFLQSIKNDSFLKKSELG